MGNKRLEELRKNYLKFGDCNHPEEFYAKSEWDDKKMIDCGVCNKRIDVEYAK